MCFTVYKERGEAFFNAVGGLYSFYVAKFAAVS
jgi:hypothetical protein